MVDLAPVVCDVRSKSSPTQLLEIARYVERSPSTQKPIRVYWTLVWGNETWRSTGPVARTFDYLYTRARKLQYGRLEDVEDIHYELDEDTGRIVAVHFVGTFSGARSYWSLIPEHYSRRVPIEEMDLDPATGRPVVYVRTWTHLLHHRPEQRPWELGKLHERYMVRDLAWTDRTRTEVEDAYLQEAAERQHEFHLGQSRAFDTSGNVCLDRDHPNRMNPAFGPAQVRYRNAVMEACILGTFTFVILLLALAVASVSRKAVLRVRGFSP